MKSWKTTVAGIAAALAAVASAAQLYFDGDPLTNPDYTAVLAACAAGIGLIFARDNGVTSEQTGAK